MHRDGRDREAVERDVDADAPTRIVVDEPESGSQIVDPTAPTRVLPDEDEGSSEAKTTLDSGSRPALDVDPATRVEPAEAQPPPPANGPERRPPTIAPGTVLFGEYEIVELLGAGGMGEVYRARHRRLGEPRAIKVMHAELSGKKGANEFFDREAKALLAVRHPAVVHCHDMLSDEHGRVYLIMEMVEGISLSKLIERQGPLPPDDVAALGARVAAGLAAAHRCGVIHRDVSPDNIVLPGGKVSEAKLIDFGIAKILREGQGTIVDGFKGKLGYASPEQLGFFGGKIDGRSDFYSLGLVLCAAALGRPLGMGTTVMEAVDARRHLQRVPDEIPIGLRSAIAPLLALDPKDRPQFVERLFVAPGGEAEPIAAAVSGKASTSTSSGVVWGLAGGSIAIAAGLAAWWVLGSESGVSGSEAIPVRSSRVEQSRTPPVVPVQPAAVPEAAEKSAGTKKTLSALDQVRIVGLLRGAEAALAEDRLQSPKGDNAYEKYRAVLEIDADNEQARRGLRAVAGRYLTLAETAASRDDLSQARSHFARALDIDPDHPRLPATRKLVESRGASLP